MAKFSSYSGRERGIRSNTRAAYAGNLSSAFGCGAARRGATVVKIFLSRLAVEGIRFSIFVDNNGLNLADESAESDGQRTMTGVSYNESVKLWETLPARYRRRRFYAKISQTDRKAVIRTWDDIRYTSDATFQACMDKIVRDRSDRPFKSKCCSRIADWERISRVKLMLV